MLLGAALLSTVSCAGLFDAGGKSILSWRLNGEKHKLVGVETSWIVLA